MVILLQAGLMVLLEEITGQAAVAQQGAPTAQMGGMGLIWGMGTMLFAIIWQMLYLGFLATTYTKGTEPTQPGELVSVGRLFFWRMLRFQIVLFIAYAGISLVALTIVQLVVLGQKEASTIPTWIAHLCSFAALAVLAKPMLLTPAIMIVRDRMVLEALILLKDYRFLEAKPLVRLFFACFATVYLLSSLLSLIEVGSVFYYALVGIYAVISSTLIVAVALSAVLFVASKTPAATEPKENNITTD